MNKQDLELKIAGLEKAIKEHKDFSATYENDLKATQKQLNDYNKPELTPMQLDDIQEVIEKAVDNFDFTDTDNYEFEPELDYDGKVVIGSIELESKYDLVEAIVEKVHGLFKEAECPTDEEDKS